MENIYSVNFFYDLLYIMFLVGLVVFIALYFVDAGYGKMRSDKWGPAMNNKAGWFLMECPVFFVVFYGVRGPILSTESQSGTLLGVLPYFRVPLFPAFVYLPVPSERQRQDAVRNHASFRYLEPYKRLYSGVLALPSGSHSLS